MDKSAPKYSLLFWHVGSLSRVILRCVELLFEVLPCSSIILLSAIFSPSSNLFIFVVFIFANFPIFTFSDFTDFCQISWIFSSAKVSPSNCARTCENYCKLKLIGELIAIAAFEMWLLCFRVEITVKYKMSQQCNRRSLSTWTY